MNNKHIRQQLMDRQYSIGDVTEASIDGGCMIQRMHQQQKRPIFSNSHRHLIEDSRIQLKGRNQMNLNGSVSYRHTEGAQDRQEQSSKGIKGALRKKRSIFENQNNRNLQRDQINVNFQDSKCSDSGSANLFVKTAIPTDRLSLANHRNRISLTKNASLEATQARNSSRENSIASDFNAVEVQSVRKSTELNNVKLATNLCRPAMTAGISTRINKNRLVFAKKEFDGQRPDQAQRDQNEMNKNQEIKEQLNQNTQLKIEIKADTDGINQLDDLEFLSALASKHKMSLEALLDVLFKVYEFDTQKMITLLKAKKKLEKVSSQSQRSYRNNLAGDVQPRGGHLQYFKKMKYFQKIALDQNGQKYDCNVQTPLTQLKLKGNVNNKKDLKANFYQSEVPHGGIWVKRNSFDHKESCEDQIDTMMSDDPHFQTMYESQFKSSPSKNNRTFYTIDAAGCRIPGFYKLTLTDKFPLVKKELTKRGKTREEIEAKLQEKFEENRQKHRNRSHVGAVIRMHEYIDKEVMDQSEIRKLDRNVLDHDHVVRKVNNHNMQAYNQLQLFQKELRKKRSRMMKKSQAIEILAREGNPDNRSPDSKHESGNYSHIQEKLHPSVMVTSIYSKASNPPEYNSQEKQNRFRTTNNDEFISKEKDLNRKCNRKFNKRKSPYQLFSEAKYNMGVYFNPPLNGL